MSAETGLVKEFLAQRDLLLGYLLAVTRNQTAAEEVFQEVALVILEEANKGKQVDHFPAWSREIARRRALEYFRREARARQLHSADESYLDAVDKSFDENVLTQEELQQRETFLRQCLEKLGGRAREVIELRYRQDRTVSEIANALAWQAESVKVALSRARKVLTDCVGNKMRALDLV